ncbi:MAG: PGF-pre-PGF domain-containing protein [Halolamina sp.]
MIETTHPRVRALLVGVFAATVIAASVTGVFALGVAAQGPDPVPASYYGTVTVDGEPAGAGVTVQAVIDGEVRGEITTGDNGSFGGAGIGEEKLTVRGSTEEDGEATVRFRVNGMEANTTVTWQSNDVRELDLAVSTAESEPANGTNPSNQTTATPSTDVESGGSGGGGGGGDSGESSADISTTHLEDQVTVMFREVPMGAEMSVDLGDTVTGAGVSVTQLDIAMKFDDPGFRLEILRPTDEPTSAPPLDAAEPVAYLQVNAVNIDQARLDEVAFSFTVNESALPAGTDAEDVALYRYTDGAWQRLETDYVGGGEYVATSPGFSEFAIGVAPEDETASESTDTATPADATDQTESPAEATDQTAPPADATEATPTPTETDVLFPGFGALTALAALLVTALLARRRR